MAIANDAFFKYQEHRAQSGYKAALLVKEQNAEKYSLLVASETVPSVFGSVDNYEFDLLNSPKKGKVAGKMSLDPKEVEVLHHRDNVYRFEMLKGKVLDFLVIDSSFVGYQFTGTIDYRMNDATADVLRGTYTITPMSADANPIMNARPLCRETLVSRDPIPESVNVYDAINIGFLQDAVSMDGYLAYVKVYDTKTRTWGENNASDGTPIDLVITPNAATNSIKVLFNDSAAGNLFVIGVKSNLYADFYTTVYVEN